MFFGPVESASAVGHGGQRPSELACAQTPLGCCWDTGSYLPPGRVSCAALSGHLFIEYPLGSFEF